MWDEPTRQHINATSVAARSNLGSEEKLAPRRNKLCFPSLSPFPSSKTELSSTAMFS